MKKVSAILLVLLTLCVFFGCKGTSGGDNTPPVVPGMPTVSISSSVNGPVVQDSPVTLTAAASAGTNDGGTLSYAWYSSADSGSTDGTLITGAVSGVYCPDTSSAGTKYYYCVVTSSTAAALTAKSNVIGVTVENPPAGGDIGFDFN